MREFLEDAEKHRNDGLGRAQKSMWKQELPKRFYQHASVAPVDGGFAVLLDGRPTLTPAREPVVAAAAGIATIMAEEWDAQGKHIDPRTMPMMRLVNAAVESGEERIPALRAEIVKYASNDLLLYRAESPRELVAEEEALWDRALVRLARHFGVSFQPTMGIVHQAQPAATLARLGDVLETENLLAITAMVSVTALTGSGLLAIGLRHGLFTADESWAAAHVDEDYNIRLWGLTDEAAARRTERRVEFDAAVKALELLLPG